MIENKTIAVVVPAYNEESQIGMVIEGMPDYVDRIVIVNDCSKDATSQKIIEYIESGKYPSLNDSIQKQKIVPNRYNEADVFVEQLSDKEDFTNSKEYVSSETKSKIVLIDHIDNGGVGAAIATVINGVWIMVLIVLLLWLEMDKWILQNLKGFVILCYTIR